MVTEKRKSRKKKMRQKKAQPKKKVQVRKKKTNLLGRSLRYAQKNQPLVIEWPRSLTHIHTYGFALSFFEGLRKEDYDHPLSKQELPGKSLWIPPRALLSGLPRQK